MKQDGITPGPWTIEGPDQFGDFNIHHPADRLAIGAVVSNLRPPKEVAANAHFVVTACNAYEPMREALILAEKADRIHSKCQECEGGAQAPEACGDCFPSADDARVARRNVLKSLGVRMRDVDRARAIKAEPSICNCSQEDVHDYGPCGEDCRSLVGSTHPVNDRHHSGSDNERLREALAEGRRAAVELASRERERGHDFAEIQWCKVVDKIDAALKSTDRQTSDDVGRLRDALRLTLGAYVTSRKLLDRSEFLVNSDPVVIEARAALKGAASSASLEAALKTGISNIKDELIGRIVLIDEEDADLAEAGKLSTDEVLP